MSGIDSLRLGVAAGLLAASVSGAAFASPCDGVSRSLDPSRKAALAPALAQQLHVPSVDVLQSFQDGGWQVLYVDTHRSDETFLFFGGDPTRQPAVTSWSGGASPGEEASIRQWVASHAPGIPARLAACFAWHVTNDRDM